MTNRRVSFGFLLFAIAGQCVMIGTVSADIVPRGSSSAAGGSGSEWSEFAVALDLSGYRDAAVSFDFASLMNQNPRAFSLTSATGTSYIDGFRLLSPVRSRSVLTGPNTGSPGHFEYSGGGRSYAMAMFNLAAYDGQSVILSVGLDRREVGRRRGMVNVDNLRISVAAVGDAVAAASIPEPTTFTLFGAALLGLLGAAGWRRKQTLPTPFRAL